MINKANSYGTLMKKTFIQYLITEKVHASTYREILADTKFKIGLEYEYFDNNMQSQLDNDDWEDNYYEHEEYLHFNEEAETEFLAYAKQIEDLQAKFDESKYEQDWINTRDSEGEKLIKKLETEFAEFVKKDNAKNGTNYKPFSLKKEKEFMNQFLKFKSDLEEKSNDRTAINYQATQWVRNKLKPYGLAKESDFVNEAPEIYSKFQTLRAISSNVKNGHTYKVGGLPKQARSLSNYIIANDILKKEGIVIPEPSELMIDTMDGYPSVKIGKEEIRKQFIENVLDTITDGNVNFTTELGDFAEAFDADEYEYLNNELRDTLSRSGEARNFEELVNNYFNHDDFPYRIHVGGYDTDDWNIVEDGS